MESQEPMWVFLNIETYKTLTGKRFRMTRDQKLRGLNRDDAFLEFVEKLQQDYKDAQTPRPKVTPKRNIWQKGRERGRSAARANPSQPYPQPSKNRT